jgi:hypothetical protein
MPSMPRPKSMAAEPLVAGDRRPTIRPESQRKHGGEGQGTVP